MQLSCCVQLLMLSQGQCQLLQLFVCVCVCILRVCVGDTLVGVMGCINVPVRHGLNSCRHADTRPRYVSVSVRTKRWKVPQIISESVGFYIVFILSLSSLSLLSHPIKSLSSLLSLLYSLPAFISPTPLLCLSHSSFSLYVTPLSSSALVFVICFSFLPLLSQSLPPSRRPSLF